MIAAELVSCVKRTLARMLFIIVSLGFGIVRSASFFCHMLINLCLSISPFMIDNLHLSMTRYFSLKCCTKTHIDDFHLLFFVSLS